MKGSIKVAIAAVCLAAAAVGSAQPIQVQVNGNAVRFPYAQPQYVNGRVLVPLRGVFEQMGAYVNWSPATRLVSATKSGTDVELHIGDHVATVNGATMNLDVPPMIIDGTTMVPIRFVSEALGAQVGWMEAQHLVSINTSISDSSPIINQRTYNETTVTSPPHAIRRVILRANDVIPVTLDHTLSSVDNGRGDTFTATVKTGDSDFYGELPAGTKIEGHVAAVHGRTSDQPAILDLAFDRILFPDGRTVRIDGTLTSLDSDHVIRNDNGVLVARNSGTTGNGQDQRMVYAGYGAGAGLLVGILEKRPLEGAILGGALGYILGQVQKDQRKATSDVTLQPGTQMGVMIHRDIAVEG